MGDAYRSEEARLAAQRKLLAEKYGLYSDDSEDEEEEVVQEEEAGRVNEDVVGDADGEEIEDGELTDDEGGDDGVEEEEEVQEGKWPGMIFGKDGVVFGEGVYEEDVGGDVVYGRELKVSGVTKYASVFGRSQGRKVGACGVVVCYAVGGHVRVIERFSTEKVLLKGHGASVVDLEILGEEVVGEGWKVVVGTVGEDGWGLFWEIVGGTGKGLVARKIAGLRYGEDGSGGGKFSLGYWSLIKWEDKVGEGGGGLKGIKKVALVDGNGENVEIWSLDLEKGAWNRDSNFVSASKNFESAEWLEKGCLAIVAGKDIWFMDATMNEAIQKFNTGFPQVLGIHRLESKLESSKRACNCFVICVEGGRVLQVYHVDQNRKIELQQTIRLCATDDDAYITTSVLPGGQYMVSSDVVSRRLFASHINGKLGVVDAITAIPIAQPVLSLYTTLTDTPATAQAPKATTTKSYPEINVWVVQPKSINMIHLPSNLLSPLAELTRLQGAAKVVKEKAKTSDIKKEVKAGTAEIGNFKKNTKKIPAAAKTGSGGEKRKTNTKAKPMETASKSLDSSTQKVETKPKEKTSLNKAESEPQTRKDKKIPLAQTVKSKGAPVRNPQEDANANSNAAKTTKTAKQTPMEVREHIAIPAKIDEKDKVAQKEDTGPQILEAIGAMLGKWEQQGKVREEKEKKLTVQLVKTVQETTKDTLQRAVDDSLSAALKDAMKVVMDRQKVSSDMFTKAIRDAKIADRFDKACIEMKTQVRAAITKSLETKCETTLTPILNEVMAATESLNKSRSNLVREGSSTPKASSYETVLKIVTDLINDKQLEAAFQTALTADEGCQKLLMMLCHKYNVRKFFMENVLKPPTVLLLAQKLTEDLTYGEADTELRMDWVREALLATEIDEESAGVGRNEILEEVAKRLGALRKEALKNKNTKLGKTAKKVGFLAVSMAK